MRQWRKIKRPPEKTRGLIVIESDDGYKNDYEYWFPKFKEFSKRYSEFAPYNIVSFCPAVNSATLGNERCMTVEQVVEMSKWTEIMNHGKYHAGLGSYPLSKNANAGQKRIDFAKANEIQIHAGYEYIIEEGSKSERVIPVYSDNMEIPISRRTGTHVLCKDNLINSYTTSAKIRISPESADLEIQGAINDLSSWGIPITSHVYPYHSGSQYFVNEETKSNVSGNHLSSRGMMVGSNSINLKGSNVKNLKAMGIDLSQAELNSIVQELKATDGVFIWYWHSSTSTLAFFERLIKTAMEAGVRIVTREEAIKHLKS